MNERPSPEPTRDSGPDDEALTDETAAAPIFIACGARSGSTLLRWIVDTHPEIACPAETDIAALLASFVQSATALSIAEPLERARAAADELMAIYLLRTGKSRWCDKSLSNVVHLDALASAWPKARFVLLHRHCMDFIASAVEAQPWGLMDYGFSQFAAVTPGDTITALVAYWIDRSSKMLSFEQRFPDRCLRVTYEDLVLETDRTVGGIWRFLGVEPVPDAATAAFVEHHDAFGPADHKVWYTRSVTDGSVGRGARVPPDRVHGLARRTINELLERLDYPTVTDTWGSGSRPSGGADAPDPATERRGTRSARADQAPPAAGTLDGAVLDGAVPDGSAGALASTGTLATTEAVVAGAGAGPFVELRVLEAMTISSSRVVDLSSGTVLSTAASSAQVSSVVVVEQAALEGLRSGSQNIGAALRSRTVRYYGPVLTGFEDERTIFDRIVAVIARGNLGGG